MTFDWVKDEELEGKGLYACCKCFVIAHKTISCEGGEHFHAKLRQDIETEWSLDHTCMIGCTGLGPLSLYVVCVCVDPKVVITPLPRARSPLASR